MKMEALPCECGGVLRQAKAAKFDFSPLADGLEVTLANVPILRCDKCGEETLDGTIIDGTLNSLAASMTTADAPLAGVELRFLRKHLLLTQEELAAQLGCNRVTVADWERDAQPISEHHELRLRALVLGGKELHGYQESFERALAAAFAAARGIEPRVERLLSNAVALLARAAQPAAGARVVDAAKRRVIDAEELLKAG